MKPDYDHLYEIAESQAGYFTTGQAASAGFSEERLSNNTKNGRFIRITRGVYRLRHFPGSPFEDLFIAWLRAGPSAVISHESALSVDDLSDVIPTEIHIIVPRNASRRRKGLRQHTNHLLADEIAQRNGLPLTTIERTLADLIGSGLPMEQIHQAYKEALQRGLTNPGKMLYQAKRFGGKVLDLIK